MSFDSFELDSALLAGVSDLGFTEPTDIQRDAIPWALEGRDLLACAMTGSGKTAAFALPILQRLVGQERGTTRALVLSPTRELALQIEQHFRDLAAHTPVKLASIFGGVGYEPQEKAFREGADVLIATPGRLLDHLRRPYANLDGLEVLVLDEADRMLDMGFIPDVRRILRHIPKERQTLFFSATLAKPIQRLAGDMLEEPVTINLERRSAPADGVRQVVYPVRHELKPALLLHLLVRHDVETALVFTRTKRGADLTGGYLKRAGVKVAVIHGDRSQQHRTRVMNEFKAGKYQVLVATDVAARGIDVEDLSHVINLDVPNQPDDYIHRVGRTARAGSTGDAMTFVAARELADLHLIEKAIGQKLERVRLDDFDYSKSAAAEQTRTREAKAASASRVVEETVEEDAGDVLDAGAEVLAAGAVATEPPSNLPQAGETEAAEILVPGAAHEEVADDASDEVSFADLVDADLPTGDSADDLEDDFDGGDAASDEDEDAAEDDATDDGEGTPRARRGGSRDSGVAPTTLERFAGLRERRIGRRSRPGRPSGGSGQRARRGADRSGDRDAERRGSSAGKGSVERHDSARGNRDSPPPQPPPDRRTTESKPAADSIPETVRDRYAELRERRRRSGR